MDWGFLPFPSVSVLGMGGLPVIVTPDLERVLHGRAQLDVKLSTVTGRELNPVVRAPEYQGLQRLQPSLPRCFV